MILPERFVLYRRSKDVLKCKWQKIPCDQHGKNIDPHKPYAWMDYATASRFATWDESRPDVPYGVGFVLNGDGWFLIDLDDCRTGEGQWTAEAVAIFQSFGGALGEMSTSGNGLHIMGKCDPSRLQDRRNKWEGNKEFYVDKRFIALSKEGPVPIGETWTDTDWTGQLCKVIPQRTIEGEMPEGIDPRYAGPSDDEELIRMMLTSKGGAGAAFGLKATVKDLWRGDCSYHGDDHSSADAALMAHLAFWTGRDAARMDRLFRQSGLMREKYGKRADYRKSTIEGAIRKCESVYGQPQQAQDPEPTPLVRETPLGKPYPVEHLGPLRAAVEAVQGMALAPVAIPAQSALTVASLAVQGHVDVDTLNGPRPVSLYALTVAQSGERKSSCDAPLMSALRDFEREQTKAQREEMSRWRDKQDLWAGQRTAILAKAKSGVSSAVTNAQLEDLGAEPVPPPSPERTVTEPTYDGLTRKYTEGMPTLGIFSDEEDLPWHRKGRSRWGRHLPSGKGPLIRELL
ncbi:phage NrS-1 polymerase family protein [Roseovarius sp. D0-M9]|uniref:phage NrS-1 polymerase family protein n=1 Tax=Roseovarius sp. D0-M9 TaxID=3127117 RepID=UPI00301036BB